MSVPEVPLPQTPPPLPPKGGLGGCAMAFLILVGVVLLLPGLCSLALLGTIGPDRSLNDTYVFTFFVAAGGIALIIFAVRNR